MVNLRLLVYDVLTQLIIWLGEARSRVIPYDSYALWQMRKDRVYYCSTYESWECCDCGLTHYTRPLPGEKSKDPAYLSIPRRPIGYSYNLRLGAGQSSPTVNMTEESL